MTLDDHPRGGRLGVAVAPTALEGSRAFGRQHEDLVLASYADLAEAVDLSAMASVEVVVAPGCEQVLEQVVGLLGGPSAPRVALATTTVAEHELLLGLLDRHGLGIDRVRRLAQGVGFEVSPRSGDEVRSANGRLLEAVAAATPAPEQPLAPPGRRARPARPRRPTSQRDAGAPPRPVPPLVTAWRRVSRLVGDRRGRAKAVGGSVLVVLVLLALAVLSSVMMALTTSVLVLVLGGAVLGCLLLLARQLHRQTGRLEATLRRQQRTLEELGQQQAAWAAEAGRRVDLTHDYLDSIAAAAATQGQDLHIALSELAERETSSPLEVRRRAR